MNTAFLTLRRLKYIMFNCGRWIPKFSQKVMNFNENIPRNSEISVMSKLPWLVVTLLTLRQPWKSCHSYWRTCFRARCVAFIWSPWICQNINSQILTIFCAIIEISSKNLQFLLNYSVRQGHFLFISKVKDSGKYCLSFKSIHVVFVLVWDAESSLALKIYCCITSYWKTYLRKW